MISPLDNRRMHAIILGHLGMIRDGLHRMAQTGLKWRKGGRSVNRNQYGSLLILALSLAGAGAIDAQTAKEVAQKAFPSVVLVVMNDASGRPVARASGFFVREDIVATNYHVLEGATSGYARIVGEETEYDIAGQVGVDSGRDLALLKISGAEEAALPIADSSQIAVGDRVYVIGNPLGLEATFSEGIVSGIRVVDEGSLLQITAPISTGSSGGPVLNQQGEVVGVAVATLRGGQNLNFAVPACYLSSLLTGVRALSPLGGRRPPDRARKTPSPSQEAKLLRKGMRFREVHLLFPEMTQEFEVWDYGRFMAVFCLLPCYGEELKRCEQPRLLNVLKYRDLMVHILPKAKQNLARLRLGMSHSEVHEVIGQPSGKAGNVKSLLIENYGGVRIRFVKGELTELTGEDKLAVASVEDESAFKELLRHLERGAMSTGDFARTLKRLPPKWQVWNAGNTRFVFREGELRHWGTPKETISAAFGSGGSFHVRHPLLKEPLELSAEDLTLEAVLPETTSAQRKAMKERSVQIGMTKDMVICAWGKPRDINRTVIAGVVGREQWCYGGIGGQYLYFENGILTSYQD